MGSLQVTRVAGGWFVEDHGLAYELDGIERDRRRGIRGNLALRHGDIVIYKTRLTLTANGARQAFLKQCQERGAEASEGPLLALEDEVARTPAASVEGPATAVGGTPMYFSETPPAKDLGELLDVAHRWLYFGDDALVIVPASVVLAYLLGVDLVWLLLVAPPSGAKTEILRAFFGYPGIYALSELTARTFASGLDTRGASRPSLLDRLDPKTMLVLKDLTSVLTMRAEERQAVFAQLREIFDGQLDRVWGTGIELHWRGRLGFVAGVTPIIDEHHGALSVLGERFVMLRVAEPERGETALRALATAGRSEEMRGELAQAMHGFLAARDTSLRPTVDASITGVLAHTADFVTRARSGVVRDFQRRFEYAPAPEGPARLAKTLLGLALGVACAHDSSSVTTAHLALVQRVALDCLPIIRRRVIDALVVQALDDDDVTLATGKIASRARFSTPVIRRALEDLHALEVVDQVKGGAGKADSWALKAEFREVFAELLRAETDARTGTFSEKYIRVPPTEPNGQVPAAAEPDGEYFDWARRQTLPFLATDTKETEA